MTDFIIDQLSIYVSKLSIPHTHIQYIPPPILTNPQFADIKNLLLKYYLQHDIDNTYYSLPPITSNTSNMPYYMDSPSNNVLNLTTCMQDFIEYKMKKTLCSFNDYLEYYHKFITKYKFISMRQLSSCIFFMKTRDDTEYKQLYKIISSRKNATAMMVKYIQHHINNEFIHSYFIGIWSPASSSILDNMEHKAYLEFMFLLKDIFTIYPGINRCSCFALCEQLKLFLHKMNKIHTINNMPISTEKKNTLLHHIDISQYIDKLSTEFISLPYNLPSCVVESWTNINNPNNNYELFNKYCRYCVFKIIDNKYASLSSIPKLQHSHAKNLSYNNIVTTRYFMPTLYIGCILDKWLKNNDSSLSSYWYLKDPPHKLAKNDDWHTTTDCPILRPIDIQKFNIVWSLIDTIKDRMKYMDSFFKKNCINKYIEAFIKWSVDRGDLDAMA